MTFKLVVIDDHPLVRQGIISVLGCDPKLEIVGEAQDLKHALKIIRELKPDIALIDLRLGDSNGLSVIKQTRDLGIECKFIILTSSSNEEDFLKAQQLGVSGYLLKEALPEEIINAIKIIRSGRKYYDPAILDMKISGKEEFGEELTTREKEVLKALGKGLSNRDIAKQLYVTENTIKKHVSQVLAKLNLGDRTKAALYAHSKGII